MFAYLENKLFWRSLVPLWISFTIKRTLRNKTNLVSGRSRSYIGGLVYNIVCQAEMRLGLIMIGQKSEEATEAADMRYYYVLV